MGKSYEPSGKKQVLESYKQVVSLKNEAKLNNVIYGYTHTSGKATKEIRRLKSVHIKRPLADEKKEKRVV